MTEYLEVIAVRNGLERIGSMEEVKAMCSTSTMRKISRYLIIQVQMNRSNFQMKSAL